MIDPEILINLPSQSDVDKNDNRNAVRAAFQVKRQCRLRVNVGVYGPGTPESPKAKYYWFLGYSPTIVCKTPAAVDHVMRKIQELMIEMNGWTSEVPDAK
jgi:hypothetical protein